MRKLLNPYGIVVCISTNSETIGQNFKDFYSKELDDSQRISGSRYETVLIKGDKCITVEDFYYTKEDYLGVFQSSGFHLKNEYIIRDQHLLQLFVLF